VWKIIFPVIVSVPIVGIGPVRYHSLNIRSVVGTVHCSIRRLWLIKPHSSNGFVINTGVLPKAEIFRLGGSSLSEHCVPVTIGVCSNVPY
jgi:hypothetical protein